MASNIENLLQEKNDQIDYSAILQQFPWIVEEGHCCVLSPGSDGFLCGLLMSKFKKWEIIGFYDDKIAVINKNYLDKNPIFLDGEIFRKGIRSMGHHMLLLNKKKKAESFSKGFANCIQPNLLRNYDGKKEFRLKYPLATIHLLVSILAFSLKDSANKITLSPKAIPPLFFTDGVFQILFTYPENVLNWLHYLRINEEWNPLKNIFENTHYTVFTLMKDMNSFFRERDAISIPKERGDRLRLSDKKGNHFNIKTLSGSCHINPDAQKRVVQFLELIARATDWDFCAEHWKCWEELSFFQFTKGNFKDDQKTLTNAHFAEFLSQNPLSWAMTSGDNIEYTLETPNIFPFDIYKK